MNFIFCLSRLLSNQVNLETAKTSGLSSWRIIGQYVLILMIVKTRCHCLVCSAFDKSLINDINITVEYRYIIIIVPTFNVFILLFSFNIHDINLLHKNAIV